MSTQQQIPLPSGANPDTVISVGKPANLPDMLEALLNWHKASVPQTLEACYSAPGADPEMLALYKKQKKADVAGIATAEATYAAAASKQLATIQPDLEAGNLTFVLHNSEPVSITNLKSVKKQLSLYGSIGLVAQVNLDSRTTNLTQALGQVYVAFKPGFTIAKE